jgi:3-dehydro-L-gulonate 2-dehydrogenase
MKIWFDQMLDEFRRILLKLGFPEDRAGLCARIFAENSRDGVYSHGVNRFAAFVQMAREGIIQIQAEPERVGKTGLIEHWDGHLAPGMYTATLAMERAIESAKNHGLGLVTVKNSNHWMRGGTYGRLAAQSGCLGICVSNTIANMPPWGGLEPRLGNNPLVIALPYPKGPLVLDLAMSQFSYGKLQEYSLRKELLPLAGGFDQNGELTRDPDKIKASQRPLPIGFWKGSGLSMILDVLVSAMSGGRSVPQITAGEKEYGLSQFFFCADARWIDETIIEEIIAYAKSAGLSGPGSRILFPGENSDAIRRRNEIKGIPVMEEVWSEILAL